MKPGTSWPVLSLCVADYEVWSLELVLLLFQYLVPDYQSFFLFCSPLIRVDVGRHRNSRIIYSGNVTWFVWVDASWPQSWMTTTASSIAWTSSSMVEVWHFVCPFSDFIIRLLLLIPFVTVDEPCEKRGNISSWLYLCTVFLGIINCTFECFFLKNCCLDITPQESRYTLYKWHQSWHC